MRANAEMKMDAWWQNRCRWIFTDVLASVDVALGPPPEVARSVGSGTGRWVYASSRDGAGDLFARYRRRRHVAGRRSDTDVASGDGRPEAGARGVLRRRTCPRCNGWVYRVPRRFIDGLTSILAPVHRYRCRSVGCGWEGNLSVKREAVPSLSSVALRGDTDARLPTPGGAALSKRCVPLAVPAAEPPTGGSRT